MDSVIACKSKLQPKSNLKSRYESKTGFKIMNSIKKLKKFNQKSKMGSKSILKAQYTKFLDQNQAQNTSLDSVTAYKSKQQPKLNLKPRYESKIGFKVVNWIEKLPVRNPNIVHLWIKIKLRIPAWTRHLPINLNNNQNLI
jgi:hypothetical protein